MDAFVGLLINRRIDLGLDQVDVARRMGCSQSRVSKLESRSALRWPLKDIDGYARAVEMTLTLDLTPIVPERVDNLPK